jgi:hypothetical protein
MNETKREENHAEQNGRGWLETIREHIACLDADRERLEELREERDGYQPDTDGPEHRWEAMHPEEAAELAELEEAVMIDGDETSEEDCRTRIEESPLSVLVRSGWYSPGSEREAPEEFEILLSTGGPALRILGELDEHGQPTRCWLQCQDWGTPWTECRFVSSDDDAILLRWASCFYFGD